MVVLLCTMVVVLIAMPSCTKDDPGREKPDWQNELTEYTRMVYVGDEPMMGLPMDFVGIGIRIQNKVGQDLLPVIDRGNEEGVINSDYYFEKDGVKYFYHDSLPIPGNRNNRVHVGPYPSMGFGYLSCFYICPVNESNYYWLPPISFSADFVWPSKGIRKNLQIYVEFNNNLMNDVKAGIPDSKGFVEVPYYKAGYWVDGESTKNWEDPQILIIQVDE